MRLWFVLTLVPPQNTPFQFLIINDEPHAFRRIQRSSLSCFPVSHSGLIRTLPVCCFSGSTRPTGQANIRTGQTLYLGLVSLLSTMCGAKQEEYIARPSCRPVDQFVASVGLLLIQVGDRTWAKATTNVCINLPSSSRCTSLNIMSTRPRVREAIGLYT